jgi:hypothetical protein
MGTVTVEVYLAMLYVVMTDLLTILTVTATLRVSQAWSKVRFVLVDDFFTYN